MSESGKRAMIAPGTGTGREGNAAIEFALLSPQFFLLLAGLVALGFAAYYAMLVEASVEAGALYASEYGWNASGITAAVVNATGVSGITASPAPTSFCGCPGSGGIATISCTSTCTGGVTPGHYVKISATITNQTILSYTGSILPASFTGQSIIRIQ